MATPRDICVSALKKAGVLGVGQDASAEDINDTFADLQDMVAQWQHKRWLIWHLVDLSIVSTGAQSYTIGPGGDIPFPVRPDRIEAAFLRQLVMSQPNQVDYPLEILFSREDYNLIRLKQLQSFPESLFYDSAYPLGVIYPYPIACASIYSIHVSVKELLSQFTSLSQVVNIPLEYFAALKYNLAIRVHASYPGLPEIPTVIGLAKDALEVIRMANTQIPRLAMPAQLIRPSIYNVFSDTSF
jgi:hypothetical protein